jgi:hypothetical protein
LPVLDEIFEGCLPADPLIRTEPFFWLQRLNLGQLFPALFPTACKDFPSSGSPRTGKKAVLVTTFSFGRLVCSFHEAWIIVKIVWNIQFFVVLLEKIGLSFFCSPFGEVFSSERRWTKSFFVVDCPCLNGAFASFFRGELLFCRFFACGKHVYKHFIAFPHFFGFRIQY